VPAPRAILPRGWRVDAPDRGPHDDRRSDRQTLALSATHAERVVLLESAQSDLVERLVDSPSRLHANHADIVQSIAEFGSHTVVEDLPVRVLEDVHQVRGEPVQGRRARVEDAFVGRPDSHGTVAIGWL